MKKITFYTALLVLTSLPLLAQTQYKILWDFAGFPNDGGVPTTNLIFDKSGNLYGTTFGGGNSTATPCDGAGCGTVFRLSKNPDGSWTSTVLHNFCSKYSNFSCLDGIAPQGGLLLDARGNLYGTAMGGNQPCPLQSNGCGIVFELSPPTSPSSSWTEKVLYNFCSNSEGNRCFDGANPAGQLTHDTSGNLFGTTEAGGSGTNFTRGTVFELSRQGDSWTEQVLYSFCSSGHDNVCPDGSTPLGGVTPYKDGNLYGTTELGGSQTSQGGGVVFRLTPGANGWTETVLYRFLSPFRAGGSPTGPLSFDIAGNLYGTAFGGGRNGQGGIFRLSENNGGMARTFSFNGKNGHNPQSGVLIDSKQATLYGSTFAGGATQGGTVFKIVAPQEETVLYNFCSLPNCADGAGPSGLVTDAAGNFYGTAKVGGANNLGVVFEIIPPTPRSGLHASVQSLLKTSQ